MKFPLNTVSLISCAIFAILLIQPTITQAKDVLEYEYAHLERLGEDMKKWQNILERFPEFNMENPLSQWKKDLNEIDGKVNNLNLTSLPLIHRSACNLDMLYTLLSIKQMWAIQMFDFAGKIPSGVAKGQLNWPGNFDGCHEIVAPGSEDIPISGTPEGFNGRYCRFQMTINTGGQEPGLPIQIGICVPSSCNATTLQHDKETFDKFIQMIPFVRNWVKKLPTLSGLTCLPATEEVTYNISTIYCIVFIGLIVLLVVSASIYDIYLTNQDQQVVQQSQIQDGSIAGSSHTVVETENKQLDPETDKAALIQAVPQREKVVQVWLAFSVFGNAKSILDTTERKGQMNCLHGIRFLSLAWVILGHTFVIGSNVASNPMDMIKQLHTLWFNAIQQATFSVDTFFLISGFLLTYLFLKETTRMTWSKWIYFYAHRFIRLTPVYMVVIFVYATWWNYMGDGPFWAYSNRQSNACTTNWWYNLLYINNFASPECVPWGWYLANDMQFYVISPLFLIPFKSLKYRPVGYIVTLTILVGSWMAAGVVSSVHNFPVMYNGIEADSSSQQVTQGLTKEANILYVKPWMRIGPYVIGVLLARIVLACKEKNVKLHWSLVTLGWIAAVVLNITVVYGLYNANLNTDTNAAYNALSRSTWALTVAWVIFACITDNGGPVNRLLSWRAWFPLSRLTYCAYLVHPMIMYWYFGSLRTPFYYTNESTAIYFLGFLMISYGMAFLVSIIFEGPVIKIEKILRS